MRVSREGPERWKVLKSYIRVADFKNSLRLAKIFKPMSAMVFYLRLNSF